MDIDDEAHPKIRNATSKWKCGVIAYLVEEKSDQALIELPGEPVVGGLRAWVPKTDLVYAH
ncbi:MAG: hypothetical protein FJW37_05450 [Acidobacteria bacterium]|nr:hypothetical protein [Acidobacteriota bacterium]